METWWFRFGPSIILYIMCNFFWMRIKLCGVQVPEPEQAPVQSDASEPPLQEREPWQEQYQKH